MLQESKPERKGVPCRGVWEEDGWSLEHPGTCKHPLAGETPLELHGRQLLTLRAGLVSVETLAHIACAYMGDLMSLYSRRTRCAMAGQ